MSKKNDEIKKVENQTEEATATQATPEEGQENEKEVIDVTPTPVEEEKLTYEELKEREKELKKQIKEAKKDRLKRKAPYVAGGFAAGGLTALAICKLLFGGSSDGEYYTQDDSVNAGYSPEPELTDNAVNDDEMS